MKFKPLHDRVLVEREESDEKSAGGIIIPDTAKEKPMQGKIIAVGSGSKDEQGKVLTSALGRRVKDKLLLVAVMEKQPGFGDGQTPNFNLHTGDWDFATYKPNGELAKKNLDACRACHAPLTQSDFLFSIEHLGN